MSEKRQKSSKPAVIFGAKTVKRVGYIDNYIFACEIKGEDRIIYSKPRRPKYHLVIIVLEGSMSLIINGERFNFGKNTYINLPTWSDIYEISYDKDFHAMVTATDKSIVEDIFDYAFVRRGHHCMEVLVVADFVDVRPCRKVDVGILPEIESFTVYDQ